MSLNLNRGNVLRRGAESVLWVLMIPALALAPLLVPVTRAPIRRTIGWICRRHAWADGPEAAPLRPLRRPAVFLVVDLLLGLLCAAIWVLILLGLAIAASMVFGAVTGRAVPLLDGAPAGAVTWESVGWVVLPGLVLFFLALSGLAGAGSLSRQARLAFSRPAVGTLEREVVQLHATLEDVVNAVDAERRRIERDLHDGVQQRVVALSLTLARAERTSTGADRELLEEQARAEVQAILDDLREVSWRLYPAMLARDGLEEALVALCDRTTLPTRLERPQSHVPRTDLSIETAAFFAASEAVSNVLKHADATRIEIRMTHENGVLVVAVRDDGVGGADPYGPGLSGITSRILACGGTLNVHSPLGGPTTVEARFVCA